MSSNLQHELFKDLENKTKQTFLFALKTGIPYQE